jgi:hypothetical protein
MMEAARTSETLVNFYQTTRCYNPEDSNLHVHNCIPLFPFLKENFNIRTEHKAEEISISELFLHISIVQRWFPLAVFSHKLMMHHLTKTEFSYVFRFLV